MDSYPAPARRLVEQFRRAAAASPQRCAAFQGAPGAYSHQAVRELLPAWLALPCFSFEDALAAVVEERAEVAVIPIENSQHGRVADIHFLLPESGLSIIAEHYVRVRHCLLGLPGTQRSQIRRAYSHPQAIGQCRQRLKHWGIATAGFSDTASAAAFVAEAADPTLAAVASRLAAELYGLDVLAEDIEDADHNTTRFVVLSRHAVVPDPALPQRTTLMFEVQSVPAALYKALGGFATNGVNLTKLESYLRGGSFSAAEFYADIDGSPGDAHVARALEELAFHSKWVRILGTYASARDAAG
ncbi:MAG: prephenate dehydratase [Polymorphobacter sp.]